MAGTPQGFPHIALHLTPQIRLDIRIWGVAQGRAHRGLRR